MSLWMFLDSLRLVHNIVFLVDFDLRTSCCGLENDFGRQVSERVTTESIEGPFQLNPGEEARTWLRHCKGAAARVFTQNALRC